MGKQLKKNGYKKQRFLAEYMKDFNGTQAAIRAGYSPTSAKTIASHILQEKNIKKTMAKKLEKINAKAEITREYVLQNLKSVAERCMEAEPVMEFNRVTKQMEQVTSEIIDSKTGEKKIVGVYKFDAAGANRSLELLGKSINIFNDVDTDKHVTQVVVNITPEELQQKEKELLEKF